MADESSSTECTTQELKSSYTVVPMKEFSWSFSKSLDMFHCNGFQHRLAHLFMDVYLQINLTNEQSYQIYQGTNCSQVFQYHRDDQRLWGLVQRVKLLRSKQLNPFDKTVIGISTVYPYEVRIRVWKINYMRLAIFIGSILLFLMSRSLVRNAIFYYTSGCAIGILTSLLIIGFVVYRMTPKNWIGIPFVLGGWSVSAYIILFLWKNFASLVLQYQKFVAAYLITVIMISFVICYRVGPPTDIRSHNLAQWALQLIAVILIYSSCQITDISVGTIALLLLWSLLNKWLMKVVAKFMSIGRIVWQFLFPQCQRLLTVEEYRQQGEEETRKALEKLRQYCQSPKANAWRITSVMSDPKRFANFVDGSCGHISEEESQLYDLESADYNDFSDDSGEDSYIVAQRYSLRENYDSSRSTQKAFENSVSHMHSTNERRNVRQRASRGGNDDMNSLEVENDLSYDWLSRSLPLKSSYRKSRNDGQLCDGRSVLRDSFHSRNRREKFIRIKIPFASRDNLRRDGSNDSPDQAFFSYYRSST
ncbi:unnamed protein product [Thelazia callipaeda]|uniref:Nuclear envelope integral membrane protein 1 n=1 Tax=Thelazia callipaeda TaxID=103827 RepID=A0A0N5D1N9_THECL|nr:unnamed protein product [Thelazia callipaeda]